MINISNIFLKSFGKIFPVIGGVADMLDRVTQGSLINAVSTGFWRNKWAERVTPALHWEAGVLLFSNSSDIQRRATCFNEEIYKSDLRLETAVDYGFHVIFVRL